MRTRCSVSRARVAIAGLLSAVATSATSEAQWSQDPRQNLAVCTASSTNDVVTCRDGGGGMIAAWVDGRGGIWAQRVTVGGNPAWTSGGVQINASAGGPAIVSDGNGGAIVAGGVHGGASGLNIVVHRIDDGGNVTWGPVALCTANGNQGNTRICTDGAGGAIVTWDDAPAGKIFARRVSAAGTAMWTANGVPFCSTTCSNATGGIYRPSTPQVLPDGSGGAMVVWPAGTGLSAQRIEGSMGARLWGTNGTTVTTIGGVPAIAPDGSGGLIVAWADTRAGFPTMQLFAQRINSAGSPSWTANGVLLRTDPNGSMSQVFPVIVSDGLGGAIVLWSENQSGVSTWGLFARRITSAGVPQWPASGTALVRMSLNEVPNSITAQPDGEGGVVACWLDRRNFVYDLYGQRVNGAGAALWGLDGVRVSGNAASQDLPAALTVTHGNSIFTWNDFRPGGGIYHVYTQLVGGSGLLGTSTVKINEIRVDQPGGVDTDEYFELAGPPGTSLTGLTYIVIGDGAGGCGVVESVTPLTGASIQADGLFAVFNSSLTPTLTGYDAGSATIQFEDADNVTHLLVSGFTGVLNGDYDTNNDGVLDSNPWGFIVDYVGLSTSGALPPDCVTSEFVYAPVVVREATPPMHVSVCPWTGWERRVDALGGDDTPGRDNSCTTPPLRRR